MQEEKYTHSVRLLAAAAVLRGECEQITSIQYYYMLLLKRRTVFALFIRILSFGWRNKEDNGRCKARRRLCFGAGKMRGNRGIPEAAAKIKRNRRSPAVSQKVGCDSQKGKEFAFRKSAHLLKSVDRSAAQRENQSVDLSPIFGPLSSTSLNLHFCL